MFFGIHDFWAYVLGTFLIILLPGPNSLYVLSTAAQRGVRRGYQAACGVFLGDSILMILSAAGVASLLKSSPILFSVVKYSGAAYLAWIGFNMIRGALKAFRPGPAADPAAPDAEIAQAGPREAAAFRKALTISLLNPKAILFFVAFFVQFVDPSYGAPVLSFLILGLIVQVFSVAYLSTLIFGGTYLAGQFRRRQKLSAGLTSGVGVVFLGFGAKLATASLS
ncbi:leucine efflux protein LeuE [Streptosporangiaceae bacterium NEAU-GS5]|nr:leucine efflux protein LeuE [Streptosporangiaceae bacterium NEAU-GS5]